MSHSLARVYLDTHPSPRDSNPSDWKKWAEATRRFLSEYFLKHDIADLIHARAALIDHMLQTLWRKQLLGASPHLALLAVGGYGRGELHPYSDIDVLALYQGRRAPEELSPFFQILWDSGLKLAQSVRTVDQCRRDARGDITLMTSWLEMRHLCGDTGLALELERNLTPVTGLFRSSLWTKEQFSLGKIEERKFRHRRFGGTAYRLEPDIKEGPGGLRDIQTLRWILRRHEGIDEPVDFCEPDELALLREGERFLWRVRFALHDVSGQPEERLLFDYQPRVALRLGYAGETVNDTVEAFMRDYYRMAGEVDRLTEVLTQQYRESLQLPRRNTPKPLNAYFQVSDGYLEIRNEKVFARHPQGMLELFLLLQQHPDLKGVRAQTIRAVRANLHRIDADFRARSSSRSLFMEILRQPRHVARELRRMNRYGVLREYWPDFAKVVGMMQYDLFHIYPVDEHTLQVLTELRHITKPDQKAENPLYHELFLQFPKPELLYLAALYHDIGKGRSGDHSSIGSDIARDFCRDHHLSIYDAGMVHWLVQHHLKMSVTSQKRDISDPDVVREFAILVGNGVRLRGLFLLTVADLRGTNPSLWTPWREALLYQLYVATEQQMRRGLDQPTDATQQILDLKSSALDKLSHSDPAACQRFWDSLPDSTLLHYTDDELAWQTECVVGRSPEIPIQVFVRHQGEHHCTEVLVYGESHARLFAPITTAFARLGTDVLYARISETREGDVLQTFLVTDADGQPVSKRYALKELRTTLQNVVQAPGDFDRPVLRPPTRRVRHFEIPIEIEFVQRESPPETRINLSTLNHPGLLWTVNQALDLCGIKITQARITTLGAQARDVFTVTDAHSRPVRDPEMQTRISETLRHHIERLGDHLHK